MLAADPAAARRHWVEELLASGLDEPDYLELLGVVSRLVAIDTFHEALGLPLAALPEPTMGDPIGEFSGRARSGRAWVPMVGSTNITQALARSSPRMRKLERFHVPTYLLYDDNDQDHDGLDQGRLIRCGQQQISTKRQETVVFTHLHRTALARRRRGCSRRGESRRPRSTEPPP